MIAPSLALSVLAAIALAAAIHRRALLELRWAPTRHTWAAVAAGLLPALVSSFCLLLPQDSTAFRAALVLGIFGLCGYVIPWAYVLFVERGSPDRLGVMRAGWRRSLLISTVFAAAPAFGVVKALEAGHHPTSRLVESALHLNAGGLFEVFLYCGFVHLRLRDAFGPLPAVVGAAAIYSLWHIGTELPLHDDPLAALAMLFVVGLLCQSLFAITRNALVVWPIFFTAGVMHDFVVHLGLPDRIGDEPAWTAVALGLAVAVPLGLLALAGWLRGERPRPEI